MAVALIKQMLKLENRLKDDCELRSDVWIVSLATCARKSEASLPQVPYGPTLELRTFHHWPGVSCSLSPHGMHQPVQLKLKNLVVRQYSFGNCAQGLVSLIPTINKQCYRQVKTICPTQDSFFSISPMTMTIHPFTLNEAMVRLLLAL